MAETDSCSCTWDSCRSRVVGALETIGLKETGTPPTAQFLKKQLRWIVITAVVSMAFLTLGILGQLGLLPMGNTLVTICSVTGALGLILAGVATYMHWNRRLAFEKNQNAPDNVTFIQTAGRLLARVPSWTWFTSRV